MWVCIVHRKILTRFATGCTSLMVDDDCSITACHAYLCACVCVCVCSISGKLSGDRSDCPRTEESRRRTDDQLARVLLQCIINIVRHECQFWNSKINEKSARQYNLSLYYYIIICRQRFIDTTTIYNKPICTDMTAWHKIYYLSLYIGGTS